MQSVQLAGVDVERSFQNGPGAQERPIELSVASELGALKTVVMCLANPWQIDRSFVQTILSESGLQQTLHNRIGAYKHLRVRQQQQALIDLFERHGATVLLAQPLPGSLSQHYTRDIGFVIDNLFFVARMGKAYRANEIAGIRQLLHRFPRVVQLEQGRIEGGDVLLHSGHVLVGLGEETSPSGVEALRRALFAHQNDRRVIQLEFTQRGVIHLDTKFNIVGPNLALIYPRSFTRPSLRWLEQQFELIEATDEETRNVEINTVALAPGKVVMQQRSERLASLLAARGIEPLLLDYSEVTRLPGSFRCTTLPLARADVGAAQ